MSIPMISGPGLFDIEVVGESHYLENFIKVCGPRCAEGVDMEVRAHLTLDNANAFDEQAVAISVNGHRVGHLPRDVARDFRRAVREGGLSEYRVFECQAHIRGGWYRNKSDSGHYGIWLDIPQDDD